MELNEMKQTREQLLNIIANANDQLEMLNKKMDEHIANTMTTKIKNAIEWLNRDPDNRLVAIEYLFGYNKEVNFYQLIEAIFRDDTLKLGYNYWLPGMLPENCDLLEPEEMPEEKYGYVYLHVSAVKRLEARFCKED